MQALTCTLSVALVTILAVAWYFGHPLHVQYAAFFAAGGFSCIEYSWYATTTEGKNGELSFTPFQSTCRPGHTTWAQFWANVLYTPFLLFNYREFIPNPYIRIILFPFNIWLLEIIEGYALILIFGKNIAWTYNTPDAYFHNNIRTGFAGLWLLLGFALEIIGYRAIDTLSQACVGVIPIEVIFSGFLLVMGFGMSRH
ncbi:hypothetical protein THRCLA_11905 [Thraustotheca clavata]|uniref:Transmembrane protein n=1 Tax=Thraustotheca clavata TaxID=74557 RepID=A0A1V9Y5E9_9STRA|nr:hypothetical protein THRCLA_11905 [Thraustotheca clavata]